MVKSNLKVKKNDSNVNLKVVDNSKVKTTSYSDINLKAWFSQLPVVTTCQVLVNIAPTEDYGTVVIEGVEGLRSSQVTATDLRAGAAMIIAGIPIIKLLCFVLWLCKQFLY